MTSDKIYKYFDSKYAPIIGYFYILPSERFEEELDLIYRDIGCMRDFYGFESEENGTITFFDFSSNVEKSVNVKLSDLITIIKPFIHNFILEFPDRTNAINDKVNLILQRHFNTDIDP